MILARTLTRYRAVLALLLFSGFAGLGYQILWTEQCALWLGHESAAVLAVLGAFFGGLALGGLAFGPHIERASRPVLCYAACELTTGLWSLLLRFAAAPIAAGVQRAIGSAPSSAWHWVMVFSSALLLFLPATAAMGATLPAMDRLCSSWFERGSLPALYAANTFGALLGVVVSAFWVIPRWGLTASASLCIVLNLLCAAVASICLPEPNSKAVSSTPPDSRLARDSLARLAATGLLGIGYEVLVQRVLSQVSEDTVYTFALLLAVYLLGSALGASAYQRWLASRARANLTDPLLLVVAGACLLGTCSLWAAERIKLAALDVLGASFSAALAAEALLAMVAFLPATIAMGALFCHLSREACDAGASFGCALGVNTFAAAAAPALCGVLVVPVVGAKWALLAIAAGYLCLRSIDAWRTKLGMGFAVAWLGLALFTPALSFVEVPRGGQVIAYEEGALAAVSVVEDADGVRRLRINNREQEGSSASRRVDARQAWLPLLLHAGPRNALFLGLGTGVTASSAAADPSLAVEAVELLPEVIAVSAHFGDDAGRASLQVRAGDARRYVRTSERSFDVIVSDNFHPARSGSGALYTVEHFQAVRERLAKHGLFCQWLPLHQLDLETLRSIVRSFVTVYPQGSALLANNGLQTPVVGLIGRKEEGRFEFSQLRARLTHFALPDQLRELGLEDEWAVLGSFIGGPAALRQFSSHAPANSDDRPIVAYRAPRIAYAPDSTPSERLSALLGELWIEPAQLLVPSSEPSDAQRLVAYWAARDRFIDSGRRVQATANPKAMLSQVRAPLLSVLRISPDFRPAYDPLLSMAIALQRSDPDDARRLLGELSRIQPVRREAAHLLAVVDSQAPNAMR